MVPVEIYRSDDCMRSSLGTGLRMEEDVQPAGNEQKPWREALALETWGLPEVTREHFSHFRWERDTSITMPSLRISSRILGRPLAELLDDQQGRHLAKQRHLWCVLCQGGLVWSVRVPHTLPDG